VDFSQALISIRLGDRMSRKAWGDPEVFVVFQKGYPEGIGINANTSEAIGLPEGTVVAFQPYLIKRSEDGSFAPWTPTQADILAGDWVEATSPSGYTPEDT
jgi:hypothetical protein